MGVDQVFLAVSYRLGYSEETGVMLKLTRKTTGSADTYTFRLTLPLFKYTTFLTTAQGLTDLDYIATHYSATTTSQNSGNIQPVKNVLEMSSKEVSFLD